MLVQKSSGRGRFPEGSKIHVELMPAQAFVDELKAEGVLPEQKEPSKAVVAVPTATERAPIPTRGNLSTEPKAADTPRYQPGPLGDLTPEEHWEAHGGYERMARLVSPSEAL